MNDCLERDRIEGNEVEMKEKWREEREGVKVRRERRGKVED